MEIDFITKPKDLQKALYQEKLRLEETKNGVNGMSAQSKRITKKPTAAKSNNQEHFGSSNEGSMDSTKKGGKKEIKRTKERSIEEIIQKVSLWRRLYNGVLRNGNLVRYSLEDAAQKVHVSKKSLDDYLLQLRFGKKYNFDFQNNKQSKVGILRSYVKKMK